MQAGCGLAAQLVQNGVVNKAKLLAGERNSRYSPLPVVSDGEIADGDFLRRGLADDIVPPKPKHEGFAASQNTDGGREEA
jgi:hypothetical protein